MLKYDSAVSFPYLRILYLENVGLSNLEPLQWIHCRKLIVLHLMGNKAISIKSLAKTKFNQIKKIELDSKINHFEMRQLARIKLNTDTEIVNEAEITGKA